MTATNNRMFERLDEIGYFHLNKFHKLWLQICVIWKYLKHLCEKKMNVFWVYMPFKLDCLVAAKTTHRRFELLQCTKCMDLVQKMPATPHDNHLVNNKHDWQSATIQATHLQQTQLF